jgi:hypothetical protein
VYVPKSVPSVAINKKPPLGPQKRLPTSQSAVSIYNLAKDELSTSKISEEELVAGLRGRLPPGPDSRH